MKHDQEALNKHWRLVTLNGQISSVLTEVNDLLPEADSSDRAFLLCWLSTANGLLGDHNAALEFATQALEFNQVKDNPRTTLSIYMNIGTAQAGIGRYDE